MGDGRRIARPAQGAGESGGATHGQTRAAQIGQRLMCPGSLTGTRRYSDDSCDAALYQLTTLVDVESTQCERSIEIRLYGNEIRGTRIAKKLVEYISINDATPDSSTKPYRLSMTVTALTSPSVIYPCRAVVVSRLAPYGCRR